MIIKAEILAKKFQSLTGLIMKFVIAFVVFIAAVQSTPIEPRIEREDGKTPWSEREYKEWSPSIVNGQPANIADFPHTLALLDLTRGGFVN